jgi:long-chain fatty acid transport protein
MRKLLLAALLVAPALGLASGFEVINTNPRDLGMSHSLVAAQQDAAATYMNPASLSKLDGLNLSLGGAALSIATTYTAPPGNPVLHGTDVTKFSPTTPYSLFAAYGMKVAGRGLGFGLGATTPGGGEVNWDDDWQGRGRIITVQRRVLGFYGNAGYEVMPWLRVGAGAIYYYGNQYFKQGIQDAAASTSFVELKTSGGGWAFQLSTEIKPIDQLTIGIDYKHQGVMMMTGDAHFSIPPSLSVPFTQDQGVSEHLTMPNLLAVGVAYRVAQPWLVTVQYNYSRFQTYQNDDFIGSKGAEVVVPRLYKDGNVIRGGVEWTPDAQLALRAGLMYDWSGLNTDALSPTLPDSDTLGGSIGAGYTFFPGFTVNGAFFYGDRQKQVATGPTAFPGSYKTDVWIAALGIVWATGVGTGVDALR